MTAKPKATRGSPPQKWPFFQTLKRGFVHTEPDVSKHDALRTAATRAGRRLKRTFRVSKETENGTGQEAREVIRVYRTK